MAAPPSCSSPCWRTRSTSFAFHCSGLKVPTTVSAPSRRSCKGLFLNGAGVSARLDAGNKFEPVENDRCTPSSSESREEIGGVWALDFPMSSQLVDRGASSLLEDWRAVRARLCEAQSGRSNQLDMVPFLEAAAPWAHEIPIPEEGCILLATEKLDAHPLLRKSVVLLLNSNNYGSFCGVILNRTLPFPAEQVSGVDTGVALGLGSCPMFLGGRLDSASSFHLFSPRSLQGFEPFLPGIHMGRDQTALFSAWNSIRQKRMAAKEVRVHVGQLEWDARSLSAEVLVFQWWKIVSCSSSLLQLEDVQCMWEKVYRLVSGCKADGAL